MNEILTSHGVQALLLWYQQNKRDLPWRHTSDPYRIWISEIMLQQTRVEAVKPYYARFLEVCPNVEALAEIPEDQFVNAYTLGQKIGLVLRSDFEPEMSLETVTILFVLRDTDGTLLYYGHIHLWNGTLCQLDIPWLPEGSGKYSVCLYFNGQIVTELTFSLSETQ